MAAIQCEHCPKTFRGESGLAWHMERAHGGPQRNNGDLGLDAETFELAIQKALDIGYGRGKKAWQVWYPCNVCGEPIVIKSNGDSHQALMGYMKEHGWGHNACQEKL